MTEAEAEEAASLGKLYLKCWQSLAEEAAKKKRRMWRIRPKHHYLLEIIDEMLKTRTEHRRAFGAT